MDHLDKKHDPYLHSPLTSYICTHAEKHMETFCQLQKYYRMNLGRNGVSHQLAERLLKKHFEMNVRMSYITDHFL